jgi:hypothetical protein
MSTGFNFSACAGIASKSAKGDLMCMFCAAIPVTAATGVVLNGKQLEAKRQAQAAGVENPETKPIMPVTTGLIVLLMIGSLTYHTLTYLP